MDEKGPGQPGDFSNPPQQANYTQPSPDYPPTYNQQGYPPGYNQQGYSPGYNQQGYSPGYNQQGYTPQSGQQYGAFPNQPGYYNQTVIVGQQPVANVVVTARPNDHLGFAIFTCLCCFWPTGIAAIVFACMSQSSSDRMDYEKAREEGNTAKILSIVSLVIGLIGIIAGIIYVIIFFVYLSTALSSFGD